MKQSFFVAEWKELYGNESDISRADIYTHIETVKKELWRIKIQKEIVFVMESAEKTQLQKSLE